jgi:hypothetical protein
MARPRKFTDSQIIEALKATHGMVYLAAHNLGCSADAIYKRAKQEPKVQAVIDGERAKFIDLAEQKLYEALERGEKWAVEFSLRTIGRTRGYVEKQEIEQTATSRLVIEEEVVSGGDDNPPGEAPQSPG